MKLSKKMGLEKPYYQLNNARSVANVNGTLPSPLPFNVPEKKNILDTYISRGTLCLEIKNDVPIKACPRPGVLSKFNRILCAMKLFLFRPLTNKQGAESNKQYSKVHTDSQELMEYIKELHQDIGDFHKEIRDLKLQHTSNMLENFKLTAENRRLKKHNDDLETLIYDVAKANDELEWQNHQLKLSAIIPAQGSNGSEENFKNHVLGNHGEEAVVS